MAISCSSSVYICSPHGRNARSFLGRFGLFDVAIQCRAGPRNVQISSHEVSKFTHCQPLPALSCLLHLCQPRSHVGLVLFVEVAEDEGAGEPLAL